jgi:hypothetical protein
MDAANSHKNIHAYEMSTKLIALAKLLGKQAAREAVAADRKNSPNISEEDARDD